MSGSIGGNRIPRELVPSVLDSYEKTVLNTFGPYVKVAITGSYNAGTKKDHGDLDLIILVKGMDPKLLKRQFREHLDRMEDVLPKFKSGHHQGKVSQMYGNIVTCGWWLPDGNYVQVDNIITVSEADFEFQRNFLNLEASKQALLMGYVRCVLSKKSLGGFFDTRSLPKPKKNQEYEFVLSSCGLSLRLVTLEDFKEVSRIEVWRTNEWSMVECLIRGAFRLKDSYEDILDSIARGFSDDERSRRRIVGVMCSMINVGTAEVGTPKGEDKINAIKLAEEKLNVYGD